MLHISITITISTDSDSRADKLIDCALFNKSTKIGTEVV